MCLFTKDATVHVASENILVYKVLTFSGFSPYEKFLYRFFKKYKVLKLGISILPDNSYQVNEGFHTFVYKEDANDCKERLIFSKVSLFVIPKGSNYTLGIWSGGHQVNIVSDQIIRIGGGLFAWWWKQKNKVVTFSDYDPNSLVKIKQTYDI